MCNTKNQCSHKIPVRSEHGKFTPEWYGMGKLWQNDSQKMTFLWCPHLQLAGIFMIFEFFLSGYPGFFEQNGQKILMLSMAWVKSCYSEN